MIAMLSVVQRTLPDWGIVYSPPEQGPFPAVLILHGSEGGWSGWSHMNAVMFAAHGFLAYPHPYSIGGDVWNPGDIADVDLDRTIDAIRAIRALDHCSGKLALYGESRGAEHALLLTALMAKAENGDLPDAIAAHSPPDVICGAFIGKECRDRGDPGFDSWDPAKRAWTWQGSSDSLKPTTPIEIERYNGPMFLSHGTSDTCWSVEMTRRLDERLHAHGRDPEVHYFEGEDHACFGEAANRHYELLLAFMHKHLS